MARFILRRLLVIVPMLLVVVSLTWGLIRVAPGNFYSGEKKLPAAIEKNIREKYGLDTGSVVARMELTVVPGYFSDSPKSPRAVFASMRPYWTYHGLSRPYFSRMFFSMAAGSFFSPE